MTGLNVATLSRAEMPSYLHASSYGPAFLSTTGMDGCIEGKVDGSLVATALTPPAFFPLSTTSNKHLEKQVSTIPPAL